MPTKKTFAQLDREIHESLRAGVGRLRCEHTERGKRGKQCLNPATHTVVFPGEDVEDGSHKWCRAHAEEAMREDGAEIAPIRKS